MPDYISKYKKFADLLMDLGKLGMLVGFISSIFLKDTPLMIISISIVAVSIITFFVGRVIKTS